jgi:hypothetical protein
MKHCVKAGMINAERPAVQTTAKEEFHGEAVKEHCSFIFLFSRSAAT